MSFFSRKSHFRVERQVAEEIQPDEILLDSSNLPQFDTAQFEGRIEKAIPRRTTIFVGIFFLIIGLLFGSKLWMLQVDRGEAYAVRSENNRLRHTVIFAERGVIYDRNNKLLAWNVANPENPDFAIRKYSDMLGLAHILGYVKYPSKDKAGFYYNEQFEGKDGVEQFYNALLGGKNGVKIIETNALGKVESENVVEPPQPGNSLTLTIDADIQNKLFEDIKNTADKVGFRGGAAAIMDIRTGEVLALTNYPEYNSDLMSNGNDKAAIDALLKDERTPFINRFVDGLYTPGSIVKPIVAMGALTEKIVDPAKQFLSNGSLILPNPYDSTKPSIFNDWRAHGWLDMRHAIAQSSNVYFYIVGGGFEDQKGLGIQKLDQYYKLFGLGNKVPSTYFAGKAGTIPTPEWKLKTFDEEWRIGDTYHTSIGQYSMQVSPMQMLMVSGIIASDGIIPEPVILMDDKKDENGVHERKNIGLAKADFKIVKEGMRLGTLEGTAKALNIPGVKIAAKTGTAEIGTGKQWVNSWVMGFFPYDNPKYSFIIMMEHGPRANLIGASAVGRQFFEWLTLNRSSMFR